MKKFNKLIIGVGSAGAIIAPVATLVSCSLFNNGGGSDLEFMNYVDYIGDTAKSQIESTYNYTEFGDLPELRIAIEEKRIAAGIGSDYYNAYLAGTGAIQKIDFARLYGIPELADSAALATKLKDIYTPEAWNILNKFDKLDKRDSDGNTLDSDGNKTTDPTKISHDVDGDGDDDHLYEYMAPYFTQNKVVGVNLARLYAEGKNKELLVDQNDESKGFIDQATFESKITDKSYTGIFNSLRSTFGAKSLIINNYMRDNMMIGSAIMNNGTKIDAPENQNYKQQIDAFFSETNKFGHIDWADSGVGTLDHLVNDKIGSDAVGILYNGDALYAHAGGSDVNSAPTADSVRIITPKNSTFLMDGLVIPTYLNDKEFFAEKMRVYDVIGGALYSGISNKTTFTDISGKVTPNTSFRRLNNLYGNFDKVNYTPAFKELYNYVMAPSSYFDGNDDGKAIMASTSSAGSKLSTPSDFDQHVTDIVDANFETEIQNYYNGKF